MAAATIITVENENNTVKMLVIVAMMVRIRPANSLVLQ